MKQYINKRLSHFFLTEPQPCPYISNQVEQKLIVKLRGSCVNKMHTNLAENGFRRSHDISYLPVCPTCNACKPVRLLVGNYSPTRSHKRVSKKFNTLKIMFAEPRADVHMYDLFLEYQTSRHPNSDMVHMSYNEFRAMLEKSPLDTCVLEFRTMSHKLVGVMITDITVGGTSAVYSFFSPAKSWNGLGTYMVITLIKRTYGLGLPYLYLGYYIKDNSNMAYKAKFQPLEVLENNSWKPLSIEN